MSTPSTGEGDGALRGLVKLLLEPRSGGAASALAGVKSMSIEASVSAVPWALVRRLFAPVFAPRRDQPGAQCVSTSGSPGLLSRRVSRVCSGTASLGPALRGTQPEP